MKTNKTRLRNIQRFVEAQARDETIWFHTRIIGENLLQQKLRELHGFIENELK